MWDRRRAPASGITPSAKPAAAGQLDKVPAAARKAAIDASDAPLFLALGGPGGPGGPGGRGMHGGGPQDHGAGRGGWSGKNGQAPAGMQPGTNDPGNPNGSTSMPASGPVV